MAGNVKNSRIWIISLLYAFWLSSITFVFYAEGGGAGYGLQFALISGGIPVVVQLFLAKLKIRDVIVPFIFTFIFIIIITISLVMNVTDYFMFIRIFNISFVFLVAIVVAGCPDSRIINGMACGYAVISSVILIHANLTGNYVWGRLFAGGIHANFWGEIAMSVGVAALALKSRTLAAACWVVVLLTLYNTSSRGSMLALAAGITIAVAVRFAETKRKKRALLGAAAIISLASFALALGLVPESLATFIYQDVLRLEDKYRGLSSGLTGRADVWMETLEIWMSNPIFGVGFRQHEALITSASSAHNAYLTMLADTGLFGLVAYLGLICFSAWAAWRRKMPLRVRSVLLAIIVSYAVLGLVERRALNAGNPISILFVIGCYYSLRAGENKPFNKAEASPGAGFLDMPTESRHGG